MKKLILILATLLSLNSISHAEDLKTINYDQISENPSHNVLLIFGTDWCGGCVKLKKEVDSLDLKDYLLCIVDAEERKDLSKKYDIKSYPTSIIVRNNSIVSKKIGYDKKEYSKWIESHRKEPQKNCQCGPNCKCKPNCNCTPTDNCNKGFKNNSCSCGCDGICNCSWLCTCGCYWSWLFGK